MREVDTREWGEFHLYDIFKISMGNKLDRGKMSDGNIAFVGRTANNNGINAHVGYIKNHSKYGTVTPYPAHCLTIALGGSIGACFLQNEPFYTSQNVAVLIPQHNQTDNMLRFVAASVFSCVQNGKYEAFKEELNKHIKTDFTFILPITSQGLPDWDYMDNYMQKIEREAKQKLKQLL